MSCDSVLSTYFTLSFCIQINFGSPVLWVLFGVKKQETFNRNYTWTYDPEPLLCDVTTSPPSPGIRLLLACLGLMCYVLAFLEVYARRVRRRICASFFREQERRRIEYLVKKRQEKLNREEHSEVATVAVG